MKCTCVLKSCLLLHTETSMCSDVHMLSHGQMQRYKWPRIVHRSQLDSPPLCIELTPKCMPEQTREQVSLEEQDSEGKRNAAPSTFATGSQLGEQRNVISPLVALKDKLLIDKVALLGEANSLRTMRKKERGRLHFIRRTGARSLFKNNSVAGIIFTSFPPEHLMQRCS